MSREDVGQVAKNRPIDDFLNREWIVVGSGRPVDEPEDDQYFVRIHHDENGYSLQYRKNKNLNWEHIQDLKYFECTNTFENEEGASCERCISLWGRRRRNPKKSNRIMAMRKGVCKVEVPFESGLGDGTSTWGAEEGG